MKSHRILAIALVMMLGAPTLAKNNVTVDEFDLQFTFFVPCLAEFVTATTLVTARIHEVDTPSGTYHYLENWKGTLIVVGNSTHRQWIGKWVSPFNYRFLKNGESFFWTEKVMLMPVPVDGIEDGPKWRYNDVRQFRSDENGEITIDFFKSATGDFHCMK